MVGHGHRLNRLAVVGLGVLALLALLAPAVLASQFQGPPASTWFVDMSALEAGAHARISCEICHPEMEKGIQPGATDKHPNPASPRYLKEPARRDYDYKLCGQCHRTAWERYGKGAHAKALAEQKATPPKPGAVLAPVCADCHNPHYAPAMHDRVEVGRAQVKMCGSCHPAQAVTYLDNYHGKAAVNLGNPKAAYCTDCHGAHQAVSLKDPKVALAICQTCHADAGEQFARVVIHPTKEDLKPGDADLSQRVAIIKAISILMGVLAALTVAFFYGHSFVWLLREIHHKLKRH